MKDITGNRYGKLVAVRPDGKGAGGRVRWLCVCDCGGSGSYYKNTLDGGRTHCGCDANRKPNLKHGMRNHYLYPTWSSMISRCENPKSKDFPDYGGRGVTVCKRWHDVSAFISDMHPRPAGKSLDRIDVDKGYSPENCRWASGKTQRRNQRIGCITFKNGMTAEEVAQIQSVKAATIRMRLHRGWSEDEILRGKRNGTKV